MRHIAFLVAFPVFAAGVPAAAQQVDTAGQQINLAGNSPAACVVGEPTVDNAVNANFSVDSQSSGTIGISQFVDQQTGQTRASSIDLSFPVTCNASHSVTLRSGNGGMLRVGAAAGGGSAAGGFSEFVTYQLQLGWEGQQLDLDSSLGSGEISGAEPGKGDMTLRVATPAGSGPLVAGQYNDAIVIEFNTSI